MESRIPDNTAHKEIYRSNSYKLSNSEGKEIDPVKEFSSCLGMRLVSLEGSKVILHDEIIKTASSALIIICLFLSLPFFIGNSPFLYKIMISTIFILGIILRSGFDIRYIIDLKTCMIHKEYTLVSLIIGSSNYTAKNDILQIGIDHKWVYSDKITDPERAVPIFLPLLCKVKNKKRNPRYGGIEASAISILTKQGKVFHITQFSTKCDRDEINLSIARTLCKCWDIPLIQANSNYALKRDRKDGNFIFIEYSIDPAIQDKKEGAVVAFIMFIIIATTVCLFFLL